MLTNLIAHRIIYVKAMLPSRVKTLDFFCLIV